RPRGYPTPVHGCQLRRRRSGCRKPFALLGSGFLFFGGRWYRVGRETQLHPRAAPARILLRRIVELDAAAMLFENLADERAPETRLLLAGGHVRLEQAAAILLRQADAVVDDVDDDVVTVAPGPYVDSSAKRRIGRHRADRLARVLDDVGEP